MEASGRAPEAQTESQFSVTMSDRERDELQKKLRAEQLAKKTLASTPNPNPGPSSSSTPTPTKPDPEAPKMAHDEKKSSTDSRDLVEDLDDVQRPTPKRVLGERAWLCSECKACEEFVVGSTKDVCAFCGCRLIYHLKTEEEYEIEALDDRDLFEDAFDEFDEEDDE